MEKRLSAALSMCMGAGKLLTGELPCEKAIQAKKALLVIVARDASANTKKKFSQKAFFYNIPYGEALTKEGLGRAAGKEARAVAVVTDKGFCGRITELIEIIP